jgi:hypothetical protein
MLQTGRPTWSYQKSFRNLVLHPQCSSFSRATLPVHRWAQSRLSFLMQPPALLGRRCCGCPGMIETRPTPRVGQPYPSCWGTKHYGLPGIHLIKLGTSPRSGDSMGSSGSGRISDYPGSSSSGTSGGARGSDDSGVSDRCAKAFSVRLEDVEQSAYYQTHGTTPSVGTHVRVSQRKRLVAETAAGESVGNLPTAYNYLASCMKEGWVYMGVVQSAASGPPVATLSIDFAATPAL